MTLGPIEVVVLAFPENNFTGKILPELNKVVENGTVSIVDGLFIHVNVDGSVDTVEIDELDPGSEVAALSDLIVGANGLVSNEDVAELTASLEPNSSAAILVFEHTWVKPLRDAVFASGGIMLESLRVPGAVVDEVLEAVAALH
jgi:Family of unknown function (DUF6325)